MKLQFFLLLFLQVVLCNSQTYEGEIINNQNDTLKVKIFLEGNMIFKSNKVLSLQEKLTVISNNEKKDYYPKDLKSFKINIGNKITTYDNIENSIFAEQLYSNKVKLYSKLVKVETNRSPYFAIYNTLFIMKPDNKFYKIVGNGWGQIITKEEMFEKFGDCEASKAKILDIDYKINSKKKLIQFLIEYEKNCY